eukprot:TRINITY_DN605_c0_g1_i1.p1 TRINITY_DN605_c0_g1~~TRINITY_DN605_c0_g1_i1.p1  ORF type:complete len:845 (+),score=253.11 TRINITY_DN605_c0_g1_i1:1006-3540(+)
MADLETYFKETPFWIVQQIKTFTKWINIHLKSRLLAAQDLRYDFADGVLLCELLEILSDKNMSIKYTKNPKLRILKIQNVALALSFLKKEGLKEIAAAEDITESNMKMTLGLIWQLILHYHVRASMATSKSDSNDNVPDSPRGLREELLSWVRNELATLQLPIENFGSSWAGGQLFCHLVEKYLPDKFKYSSLDKSNTLVNLKLAFDIAERELGIPKLLEAEDMLRDTPDENSVMTYISFFPSYVSTFKRKQAEEQQKVESEQLLRQQSQQVITKLEMSVDELKAELDRERNARKLAEQENVKMKAKMDQMANDNFKMSQELSALRKQLEASKTGGSLTSSTDTVNSRPSSSSFAAPTPNSPKIGSNRRSRAMGGGLSEHRRKRPFSIMEGPLAGDALQAIKTFVAELEVKNDNELKELAEELQEQIKALKENCADLTNQVSALNEQIDDLERTGDSPSEAEELKKEVEEFRTLYKEEKKRLEKVVAMETGLKKEQRSRARFSKRMLADEMEGLREQLEAQTATTTHKRRLQRTKSIDLNSLSNRINMELSKRRDTRAELTDEILQLQKSLQFESDARKDAMKSKNEMKIRLAELEKMLETEKEARHELESMKTNLESILDSNNNPTESDLPEALNLAKEFETLKETLDAESIEKDKLKQDKLNLEDQLNKMAQLANDEISARARLELEYDQLKAQLHALREQQANNQGSNSPRESSMAKFEQKSQFTDVESIISDDESVESERKNLSVDELLSQLMVDIKISQQLKKIDDGIYQIGAKKVKLVIISGCLVVRVGGGFMPFRDWLVKYGKQNNILVKTPTTTTSTSRVGVSVRTAGKTVVKAKK